MTWGSVSEIVAGNRSKFAACEALLVFARNNRPSEAPARTEAGQIVMRTYVRSSKTYQAALRLALVGYGVQAGMLARSLFEDMAVAHWAWENPDDAPVLIEKHMRHTRDVFRGRFDKYDLLTEAEADEWQPLSEKERTSLDEEFARGNFWWKRSLYEVVKEIEHQWPDERDRRLLWQVFDITHSFNNALLHHTGFALGLAAEQVEDRVRLDVGPSNMHVADALGSMFFSYVQTTSLVLRKQALDELLRLYSEHIGAFVRVRPEQEKT